MGGCCAKDIQKLEGKEPLTESLSKDAQASPERASVGLEEPQPGLWKTRSVQDLEAWYHGSVVEAPLHQLEWINHIVRELWPHVEKTLQSVIANEVEPALKKALPMPAKGAKFTKVQLGKNVPELGPVHVYEKNRQGQNNVGLELDVGLKWNCDADIELHLMPGINLGIKSLTVAGELSVILRPLMDTLPIVGGMQISMISPPTIQWDFLGIANFADLPGIQGAIRNVVMKLICEQLVLPNRLFIHWVQGREAEIDITSLHFPRPESILRLCVREARGLDARDFNFFSKASSDPYVVVNVGARSYRTPTLKATLAPLWGDRACADFFIFNPRQVVKLEVFDEDLMPNCDDSIGTLEVMIGEVLEEDKWYPIHARAKQGEAKGRRSGEVFLVAEILDFKAQRDCLLRPPPARGGAAARAFLSVQIWFLRGLAKENATGAVMRVSVGKKDEKSNGIDKLSKAALQVFETKPSVFEEVAQDASDAKMKAIDPSAQRMAEFMFTQPGMSIQRISQISGLDEYSLGKVLSEHPSFFTRWHQGFNILLEEYRTAVVDLELLLPGCAKSLPAPPKLERPFEVATLLKEKAAPESDDLTWEGVLTLQHQARERPHDVPAGPFDVYVKFCLLGLQNQQ